MRDILFYGKSITDGEWVEGGYCKYQGNDYICIKNDLFVQVDTDTVSQFTGMTDKNGVKIFEGDIIKFKYQDYGEVTGFVFYDDQVGFSWQISIPSIRWDEEDYLCNYRGGDCEIIGNKWDDFKLLESKNE